MANPDRHPTGATAFWAPWGENVEQSRSKMASLRCAAGLRVLCNAATLRPSHKRSNALRLGLRHRG